jgi:hypothetical protein
LSSARSYMQANLSKEAKRLLSTFGSESDQ